MWTFKEKKNGDIDFVCGMVPRCAFCDVPMKVWMTKKLNFDIIRGSGDKMAHAIDVEVNCPKCGLHEVFGVAVSKKEYDKVRGVLELTH